VAHETTYQSLFVQGRGAVRKELHWCRRTPVSLPVAVGRRLSPASSGFRSPSLPSVPLRHQEEFKNCRLVALSSCALGARPSGWEWGISCPLTSSHASAIPLLEEHRHDRLCPRASTAKSELECGDPLDRDRNDLVDVLGAYRRGR
jgi:hypothetical protein